ncbi:macrolide family glycosyltransferase [Chengkuizengella marina]|uniref:Erythromycin biosynthesis protein CIII-like C-terminal domain-containing protein n=1 Tax=Chengkuizengella marina TaxID=2507566 RepID=A0A6N9PY97_9BACL|nr:macrolide family glycosyltransferase [Chengkuizengella marina]NBI27595.1 hypothetical protein [Chengkuizengella marina]
MSTVIYFGVDLAGHVNPTLGLMKKLVDTGEEVFYYCTDEYREKIEETGAKFKSYRDLAHFGTYDGDGIETFLVFADFILSKSKIILDNLLDEIVEIQPDYIIHDAFCYWGKEVSNILNIPGISVFDSFAFIDEMADIDPSFFMENILRAGEDPLYKKYKGNTNMYKKLIQKVSKSIARKHNLQDTNVINDIFLSKQGLNILFTSKQLQIYSEAFDDSYLFTGYSIYHRNDEVNFSFEKLEDKPLVYISLGTIFNDRLDMYKSFIKAFSDEDIQVIMSVGQKVNIEELGYIPQNFTVKNVVPQLEVLKQADVFITHGGANSVHESINFLVPMVVLPQNFDQFMGAMAVERVGTGIYIRNQEEGISNIKIAVNKVLTETIYMENCREIKDSFKKAGGLENAVDEIFKFVGNKRGIYENT